MHEIHTNLDFVHMSKAFGEELGSNFLWINYILIFPQNHLLICMNPKYFRVISSSWKERTSPHIRDNEKPVVNNAISYMQC